MSAEAITVQVEFRFDTATTDSGTGAVSRTYVGLSYADAIADLLSIIDGDQSMHAADIGRITAEPRPISDINKEIK